MEYTDLVMLDIKHIDKESHKALTCRDNDNILAFAKYLYEKRVKVWIRYVLVPGYTDGEEALLGLADFISPLKNIRAIEVLPYHTMGVSKYAELGIDYPLKGIEALPLSAAKEAKQHILNGIRSVRDK